MELTPEIRKYIDKSVLCWLATVSKKNMSVVFKSIHYISSNILNKEWPFIAFNSFEILSINIHFYFPCNRRHKMDKLTFRLKL